jgi:hypothetical protein
MKAELQRRSEQQRRNFSGRAGAHFGRRIMKVYLAGPEVFLPNSHEVLIRWRRARPSGYGFNEGRSMKMQKDEAMKEWT